jgi:hypothetical protein
MTLGIKTHRRETSIGIAISLGLALAFYFVIVLANTLKSRPYLYPEAILVVAEPDLRGARPLASLARSPRVTGESKASKAD